MEKVRRVGKPMIVPREEVGAVPGRRKGQGKVKDSREGQRRGSRRLEARDEGTSEEEKGQSARWKSSQTLSSPRCVSSYVFSSMRAPDCRGESEVGRLSASLRSGGN